MKLEFPMELKWLRSDAPWKTIISRLPGGEIMHTPVEGDSPPWALTRGPVVYAVDTLWWTDEKVAAPSNAGEDLGAILELTNSDIAGGSSACGWNNGSCFPQTCA